MTCMHNQFLLRRKMSSKYRFLLLSVYVANFQFIGPSCELSIFFKSSLDMLGYDMTLTLTLVYFCLFGAGICH